MLPSPIQWLAPAVLARLVLLLNHVVASEPQAAARLKAHSGRVIDIRWATGTAGVLPAFLGRVFQGDAPLPPIRLLITPAGLFEAVAENAPVASLAPTPPQGLTLTVQLGDPIDLLKRAGCKEIRALVLVAAPVGIDAVLSKHPDVHIYTASIDDGLNEHGYIMPGLGDAGDRIFGTTQKTD